MKFFPVFHWKKIATTANKNYQKMNSNFRSIQSASKVMQSNQRLAINQMNSITAKERMIYRKALFLEFSSLTNNIFNNYIFQLQTILEGIKLSPPLDISFHLLASRQKCSGIYCYENPYFKIINETSLSVTFQHSQQTLSKSAFITCTITSQGFTSIYSNTFALLSQDNTLLFQNKDLKSLKLSDLLHPRVDEIKKTINTNNCLMGQLCPIFSNRLVSFQCQNLTTITIDDTTYTCAPNILNFLPFPTKIKIHDKIIHFQASSHFSQKINKYSNNHKEISLFQNRNENHTILKKIGNVIQYATPNSRFAFFSGLFLVIFIFVICCFLLACFRPGCLDFFLSCCNKSCCLRQTLQRQMAINQPINQTEELQPMNRPQPGNHLCTMGIPACKCLTANHGSCIGRQRN